MSMATLQFEGSLLLDILLRQNQQVTIPRSVEELFENNGEWNEKSS